MEERGGTVATGKVARLAQATGQLGATRSFILPTRPTLEAQVNQGKEGGHQGTGGSATYRERPARGRALRKAP